MKTVPQDQGSVKGGYNEKLYSQAQRNYSTRVNNVQKFKNLKSSKIRKCKNSKV